jgi:hypothetical protein
VSQRRAAGPMIALRSWGPERAPLRMTHAERLLKPERRYAGDTGRKMRTMVP